MKTFWYVYRKGYSGPTVEHATPGEAITEANRLFKQHPGATFEILQCIAVVKAKDPETVWVVPQETRTQIQL